MKTSLFVFCTLITLLTLPSCQKANTTTTTELKFISLTASKTTIPIGGSTTIAAEAQGNGLVYSWSATAGDIIGSGKVIVYAGSSCCVGPNEVTCSISDAASKTAVNVITITVE